MWPDGVKVLIRFKLYKLNVAGYSWLTDTQKKDKCIGFIIFTIKI